MTKEGLDAISKLSAEALNGSTIEIEYKKRKPDAVERPTSDPHSNIDS